MSYAESQYVIDEITTQVNAIGWKLPPPTNLNLSSFDEMVKMTWTDPEDVTINGAMAVSWAGTVVVRKIGSAPVSQTDGEVVCTSTTRNAYQTEPFVDSELTNETSYYYGIFPYTNLKQYTTTATILGIPKDYIVYAMHIDSTESDPDSMITYPSGYDNSSFTNLAHMDFTEDVFDLGDWENAFFMPKSCMLKYDGTVDYYLNENDETKKADGTDSDVANVSYAGNAMMEWGQNGYKLYWKVVPDEDGNGETFIIATAPLDDDDMKAWNHINCNGEVATHFYTPKYFGSSDGLRMRSRSGGNNYVNNTAQSEINLAKANNQTDDELWYTEVFADRQLINYLLLMMAKSTNTQLKYGNGRCASGNTSAIAQGTMNGKGMFYGKNDQTSGVKVFGMENYWGNLWRRTAGYINANGTIKCKLCYGNEDGSTVDNYNLDGTGYVSTGTIAGTGGGFISAVNHTSMGMTPKTASGSSSTYYPDGAWFNNAQNDYAFVGGDWAIGLSGGALCSAMDATAAGTNSHRGAALSCKPLN